MKQTIKTQNKTTWRQYLRLSWFLLMFFPASFTNLQAQRMLYENGTEYARKLSENIYKPVPEGVVSYKVENNQFWSLLKGVPESNKPKGYCKYTNNMYIYYDSGDNIVASYVPSQSRYYLISAKGEDIIKEISYAVLFDGVLHIGGEPSVRYTVEEGFNPVVVGFFLFIH
ncbi:MAG: hypothetical protein LBU57_00805 [Dysgonamonadaceae bacterium]|jgi:hypothetical protein|nr:hypothetical protein [Dysgonamonadaceae bacterium]